MYVLNELAYRKLPVERFKRATLKYYLFLKTTKPWNRLTERSVVFNIKVVFCYQLELVERVVLDT